MAGSAGCGDKPGTATRGRYPFCVAGMHAAPRLATACAQPSQRGLRRRSPPSAASRSMRSPRRVRSSTPCPAARPETTGESSASRRRACERPRRFSKWPVPCTAAASVFVAMTRSADNLRGPPPSMASTSSSRTHHSNATDNDCNRSYRMAEDNDSNPSPNKDPLDTLIGTLGGTGHPRNPKEDRTQASDDALSPALLQIRRERRPSPMPVCGACPKSVWWATAKKLECYCQLMHARTWTSEDPQPIESCDGFLSRE